MKAVVIVGKFAGKTAWDIENNIRVAEAVALKVAEAGCAVLCPHTNSRFFFGQLTEEFWRAAYREWIKRADAIVVCHNYTLSEGSKEEIDLAQTLGLPCFYVDALGQIGGGSHTWVKGGAE